MSAVRPLPRTRSGTNVCPHCGLLLGAGTQICRHHEMSHYDGWAAGNRIACDFFHRKKVRKMKPMTAQERTLWLLGV